MKKFISKFLPIKILGNSTNNPVDVIFDETTNLHRLAVDQVVKIESLRSFSDIADNWFFINSVGNVGDQLTLEIDSSDGVFDVLGITVYSKVFTTQAGEDRNDFCDRIVNELNADSNFLQVYRAVRVKDSPIVIIKSRFFGEWGEVFTTFPTIKPDSFRVTVTGGLNCPRAFTDFKRRNKLNAISTDPRDERYGQIGISGNVSIGGSIGNYYQEYFTNATHGIDMSIRADLGGPYVYRIPTDATRDLEIFEIRIFFSGNGINLGDYFGTSNSPLTNGIQLNFKTDNELKTLGPYYTNSDLKNTFAVGSPTNFRLDKPSGSDELLASFAVGSPIVLRKQGTFGASSNDDYLEIVLADRFDNITDGMRAIAVGFKTDF